VEGSINRRISNEAGLDKKGDSPKWLEQKWVWYKQ
jgi:hypothetical protein